MMKLSPKLNLRNFVTIAALLMAVQVSPAAATEAQWSLSQSMSPIRGNPGMELQMLSLTSTYPQGYNGKLVTLLDDSGQGRVIGVRYEDSRDTKRTYSLEDLKKGIVLVAGGNREMIKIVAPQFDALAGGAVNIIFNRTLMSGEDKRQVVFEYLHKSSAAADWITQTNDAQGREFFGAVQAKISTSFMLPNEIEEIVLNLGAKLVRRYKTSQLPRATQ